jgi:hypothetical protein
MEEEPLFNTNTGKDDMKINLCFELNPSASEWPGPGFPGLASERLSRQASLCETCPVSE